MTAEAIVAPRVIEVRYQADSLAEIAAHFERRARDEEASIVAGVTKKRDEHASRARAQAFREAASLLRRTTLRESST